MRSTFKLLFYINRKKIKASGLTTVMGRITIDGKVAQYSTGVEVEPTDWDSDKGRTKGDKDINTRLVEIETQARLIYKKSVDSIGYVSAEIVKNGVTGRAQAKVALIALFDEFIEEFRDRVGIDRVKHTLSRYNSTRRHIYNFLRYKYDVEDVSLRSLDMQFINEFHFYLSTVLQLKTNTLNGYLILLRKIAKIGVKQKSISRDPFAGYKLERVPINHRYLTTEQINKLMSVELAEYHLCHTRDLFIFSVFTGLGRADLVNLSYDNIITEEDGSKWIHIARQKTNSECNIKLVDIPLMIMAKYKGEGSDNKVFYVQSAASINRSLGIIAERCNLGCHLTYYQSRHSFATNCLNNNVPIETISKMMGHSNIRITQIYAEITNQKVGRDFTILAEQTKDKYKLKHTDMPLRRYHHSRKVANE
ncbi:MAG: site-specific integrase [Rikenellaceae bacterium]